MLPIGREHITEQTGLEALLLRQHLFFKAHLVLFKIGLPLLAAAFGLLLNGRFQLLDTVQKFLNLGVHGVSLGGKWSITSAHNRCAPPFIG
jgi:hypothetical protein